MFFSFIASESKIRKTDISADPIKRETETEIMSIKNNTSNFIILCRNLIIIYSG